MAITITYTFTPNTTILSSEVNANFSLLGSRATDKTGDTLTGDLNTRSLVPTSNNAYDLGSATLFFRQVYVAAGMSFKTTGGNAYNFTWTNPSAPRAVSFEDPGGTDIVVYKAATQTLTNKTLTTPLLSGIVSGTYTLGGIVTITAPILSGTLTGTYTLGGTPTIPASGLTGTITSATQDLITRTGTIISGVWNAGAVTSSGAVTGVAGTFSGLLNVNGFGQSQFNANGTGMNNVRLLNGTAGAANGVNIELVTDGSGEDFLLQSFSSTYTTSGTSVASGTRVLSTGGGGLTLASMNASGFIDGWTGATPTKRFRYDASGNYILGAANITDAVATPTHSSGLGGAGLAITGKVFAFKITLGAAPSATGVVNFNMTFANAPICVVTPSNGAAVAYVNPSTTQLSLTYSGTPVAGDSYYVIVRGF